MYRYLLFANDDYYPFHGMYGCKLRSSNKQEVIKAAIEFIGKKDMIQYYDTQTGKTFELNFNPDDKENVEWEETTEDDFRWSEC